MPIGIHYGYNLAFRAFGALFSAEISGPPYLAGASGWFPETGIIGVRRLIVPCPPALAHAVGWLAGRLVGDVIVTRAEIRGLMDGLLHVDAEPAGPTRLTEWAAAHAETLGRRYASELGRRRDRRQAYA